MGWSCGELFEYSNWYWTDSNVESCRRQEAELVCSSVFGISKSGSDDHHMEVDQDNTGVNLFEINMFGESHGISHGRFIIVVVIISVLSILAFVGMRRLRRWARGVGAPPHQADPRTVAVPRASVPEEWAGRAQPCVIQLDPRLLMANFRRGASFAPSANERVAEAENLSPSVEDEARSRGGSSSQQLTGHVTAA